MATIGIDNSLWSLPEGIEINAELDLLILMLSGDISVRTLQISANVAVNAVEPRKFSRTVHN